MKPQAVSGSDLSLYKAICVNPGLNTIKVYTDLPSDIDPHTSRLQNYAWFVTSVSYDIEPDIIIPTSQNIFVSADLDHDLSAGLNPIFRKKYF